MRSQMQRAVRIAVSADDGSGLDSVVSPHFGRCPHFIIVDLGGSEVQQVTAVDNPYRGHHQPGQVPRFIREQGADVMLTGGMGMRAISLFQQFGIEAVTGAFGTVRRSLEQYLGGALEGAQPCRESVEHAHDHEGISPRTATSEVSLAGGEYEEDEVGRLREEVAMMQEQLDKAMARLKALSGDA
ncbi:MAG: NifB/NifX family molybdenum-iron cluster-binding protein [Anaerolineae bacterium]